VAGVFAPVLIGMLQKFRHRGLKLAIVAAAFVARLVSKRSPLEPFLAVCAVVGIAASLGR